MKKSDRIEQTLRAAGDANAARDALDPRYADFFRCFNEQHYFEAHDVLEHLWLRCADENRAFYQGLIQIAGAFVHLQKQFRRPHHPKDATRLRPATRLLRLGVKNLEPFAPRHLALDVEALCRMCEHLAAAIVASHFQKNPWHPEHAPSLRLE